MQSEIEEAREDLMRTKSRLQHCRDSHAVREARFLVEVALLAVEDCIEQDIKGRTPAPAEPRCATPGAG